MLARWGRWRSWWEGTSWAERRPGDAGERWRGEGRDSRGGEGSEGGYRPWRRARTRLRVPCTQRSSKNRSRPSSPRPAVPRCPIWCPVHPPRPRSPIARPVRESPCAPPQRCAVTPRTLPVPVATRCPRRIHPPRAPPAHSGDLRACGRPASPAAPRANSSRPPSSQRRPGSQSGRRCAVFGREAAPRLIAPWCCRDTPVRRDHIGLDACPNGPAAGQSVDTTVNRLAIILGIETTCAYAKYTLPGTRPSARRPTVRRMRQEHGAAAPSGRRSPCV